MKFPTGFLVGKVWPTDRKYSEIEALVYLLNKPDESLRQLAEVFKWKKSTVGNFINKMVQAGYLKRKVGHEVGQKLDKSWTQPPMSDSELQSLAGQKLDKSWTQDWTHLNKDNNNPPDILSTTNVVSNISFPPKGEVSNEITDSWLDFVDFKNWINVFAPRVSKMKEPFTEAQFHNLLNDFEREFICDLLKAMHNYEPLTTKNRNANLTFRNWAKRRKNWNNENSNNNTTRTAGNASSDELLRAVAEGISRANTPQEWTSRTVNL